MFGCWCFVCLSLLSAWTFRHLLFSVDTILLTSGSRKLWERNNHRQENGHICSLQQPGNHLLGLCCLRPSCKDKDIAIGLVCNSLWHCSFICLWLLLTSHKLFVRAGILYVVWIVAEHHYLWEWWTTPLSVCHPRNLLTHPLGHCDCLSCPCPVGTWEQFLIYQ